MTEYSDEEYETWKPPSSTLTPEAAKKISDNLDIVVPSILAKTGCTRAELVGIAGALLEVKTADAGVYELIATWPKRNPDMAYFSAEDERWHLRTGAKVNPAAMRFYGKKNKYSQWKVDPIQLEAAANAGIKNIEALAYRLGIPRDRMVKALAEIGVPSFKKYLAERAKK